MDLNMFHFVRVTCLQGPTRQIKITLMVPEIDFEMRTSLKTQFNKSVVFNVDFSEDVQVPLEGVKCILISM